MFTINHLYTPHSKGCLECTKTNANNRETCKILLIDIQGKNSWIAPEVISIVKHDEISIRTDMRIMLFKEPFRTVNPEVTIPPQLPDDVPRFWMNFPYLAKIPEGDEIVPVIIIHTE